MSLRRSQYAGCVGYGPAASHCAHFSRPDGGALPGGFRLVGRLQATSGLLKHVIHAQGGDIRLCESHCRGFPRMAGAARALRWVHIRRSVVIIARRSLGHHGESFTVASWASNRWDCPNWNRKCRARRPVCPCAPSTVPGSGFSRTLKAMEVHFTPRRKRKLKDLSTQSGRRTDDLVEDAMAGYLDEVLQAREMLNSRYDDLKSGRVKPISRDQVIAHFREKSAARRSSIYARINRHLMK